MNWSPDHRIMYFTDSIEEGISAYDYDAASGSISDKRILWSGDSDSEDVAIAQTPDGPAIDEEGYLWVAVFGGEKFVRVSPAGEVFGEIRLPTRCVTDVAFAEDELFIITANEWSPKDYPESLAMQGHLLKCIVGFKGQKMNRFGFSKDETEKRLYETRCYGARIRPPALADV